MAKWPPSQVADSMHPHLGGLWSPILFVAVFPLHAQEHVTVKTEDTGAALVNPGMGWPMHFYSNVPTDYGSNLAPADTGT